MKPIRQPKTERFQLFLHEMHEPTAASAAANGTTLSSEVRRRVKRSFEQDAKLAELRAWAEDELSKVHHRDAGREGAFRDVLYFLDHASPSA